MNLDEQIEDETIEELGLLTTEVSDLVDRTNYIGTGVSPERDDLIDRINQFEFDHSRVTEFLSHLLELLKMIEV